MAKNLEGTDQGAGLLAAMNRTLAPQQMTFDQEEKQRREAAGLTYTPVVQPTVWIWSRELVALVEEHSQGTTGPVPQFQSRNPSVLKKIQDEVVAVHRLIRERSFRQAGPFNSLQQAPPPATLEDKVRCWDASKCVKNRHILPAGAESVIRS